MNDYYDVRLKEARLAALRASEGFDFARADIADPARRVNAAVARECASRSPGIVHLAAQAGVRYSLVDPYAYVQANVMGQVVILELCRCRTLPGSSTSSMPGSSSVYGGRTEIPFPVEARVDSPVSLYAATKRAGELIGHVYGHLFAVPATGPALLHGLRPLGPAPTWPPTSLPRRFSRGRPVTLFNHGRMKRDFTYIDDVTSAVLAVLDHPPPGGKGRGPAPPLQYRQQPRRGR